ncbi:MAG TPA: cellulose binding domain-containing protein, partial [Pseudonocardiaceae bacterium]|nr:cellulose binding domain-containing protein [Pseudonocardiaceae bacterium]
PPPANAGPLGPVLLWLLRADPAGRPTMARAAAALGAVADGRPVAPPTMHLPVGGPRRPRRRTVLAGLVAVGLVTAGLVTGILISAGDRPAGITASGRPPTAHTRNIPAPTTPAPTTAPPSACTASYHVTGSWPGGFQATVTVNARTTPLNGWQVTWDLPDGQTITNLWNGALSQQGTAVTVTNLPYNATPANGPITFGFNGGRTGTSAAPPTVRCTAHQ